MRPRSLRSTVIVASVGVLVLTTVTLIAISSAVLFTNYRGLLKQDLVRQSQHILEEVGFTASDEESLVRLIEQEPFSTRFVTLIVSPSGSVIAESSGPSDIESALAEDVNSLTSFTPTEKPVEVTTGDSRLMVFGSDIPNASGFRVLVVGSTDSIQEEALAISAILAIAGSVGIVAGSALLVVLLGRAVRPIREVAAATGAIDADATARISVPMGPTEATSIAHEVNELLSRVEHDQLERKQLLATISHEMRTPLAIAQGQLEALERYGTDDEEVRNAAGAARQEIRRVTALVDSALTLARAAAPGFVSLRHVSLSDVAEDLALRLSALDAHVVVNAPPRADVTLDPERIAQAILNLVINSVTHNPDGVRVDVHWQVDAQTVDIFVEDDGIGFPEIPHAELVKPFVSGRPGSSGLGLAVVESVIVAHGGHLTLSNPADSGARVTLSLPRNASVEDIP
jgi:two-component system OmpR family sensor kinase